MLARFVWRTNPTSEFSRTILSSVRCYIRMFSLSPSMFRSFLSSILYSSSSFVCAFKFSCHSIYVYEHTLHACIYLLRFVALVWPRPILLQFRFTQTTKQMRWRTHANENAVRHDKFYTKTFIWLGAYAFPME